MNISSKCGGEVFIIGGLENFLNIYNQFSYTLNLFTNLITSRASILSIFQSFEMCRVLNFITLFQKACVFKWVWVRSAICHPYSVRCPQHLRIEHGLFLSIYCAHVCWPQRACKFPLSYLPCTSCWYLFFWTHNSYFYNTRKHFEYIGSFVVYVFILCTLVTRFLILHWAFWIHSSTL